MGLTIMKGETWPVVAETAEVMGYREEADPKGNGTQETSQPQSRCSSAGVQGVQGCTGWMPTTAKGNGYQAWATHA